MSVPLVTWDMLDGAASGIAVVKLSAPPVNALSAAVCQALRGVYDCVLADRRVHGIVLCGAGRMFAAGADIAYIHALQQRGDEAAIRRFILSGHELLSVIESGRVPTVAAVHGVALGGGCELAMACRARVVGPRTIMGLPEIKLGLFPGLGGTQRLPRLVGLAPALAAILSGRPVRGGAQLHAEGLADAVAPNDDPPAVVRAAAELCRTILRAPAELWPRTLARGDRLALGPGASAHMDAASARRIAARAEAQLARLAPALRPTARAAVAAAVIGAVRGAVPHGIAAECARFSAATMRPAALAMCHLFSSERVVVRAAAARARGARRVCAVGVVGAGAMGSGIVAALLLSGLQVTMTEANARFLTQGQGRVAAVLDSCVARKRLPRARRDTLLGTHLTAQVGYAGFERLDVVIEAVLEVPALKQRVFRALEQATRADCVLATNTSTLPIELFAGALRTPERRANVVGLHFFNPVHMMRLLEVVRWRGSSARAIGLGCSLGRTMGKLPIVVRSAPGFAVNAILLPLMSVAQYLVEVCGVAPEEIDAALMAGGMPLGVFRLIDLVGTDVTVLIMQEMARAVPGRVFAEGRLFAAMAADKRLGTKNRRGFYAYTAGAHRGSAQLHADSARILARVRAEARASGIGLARTWAFTRAELRLLLLGYMYNEACRLLGSGVVASANDIDIATLYGLSFPAAAGGVCWWGDQAGSARVARALAGLAASVGSRHAPIFAPCAVLERIAMTNTRIHDWKVDAKL